MKVVCVIPTYNEKENIVKMIERIRNLYPEVHMLIVDDNSPDGTGEIVEKLKNDKLDVLHRKTKDGLGKAYQAGFKKAIADGADIIVQIDADFSHDPIYIKKMLELIDKNDVVIGSRYVNGISIVNWSLSRLILSWFGNAYARFMTGIKINDLTGGYKCMRKEALESINFDKINSAGYGFQIEMNCAFHQNKMRITEIPIIFYERTVGQSNMSKSIVIEAMAKTPFFRFKNYRRK